MPLQRPVNRAQRRQRRILLLPLAIEHLDRNRRLTLDLRHDQRFLLGRQLARRPAI
jgi:hypothetical protein